MVSEACGRQQIGREDLWFTRREIRRETGMSYEQVRVHLERLIEMEYVLVHRGGRGQSFVYELLYDGKGQDGKPFVMGLIAVETLGKSEKYEGTTSSLGGEKGELPGSYRGHTGPIPGGYRSGKSVASEGEQKSSGKEAEKSPKNAHLDPEFQDRSYPQEEGRRHTAGGKG
jgi:DNA-binding transcriptional ArsR family regulator